MRRLIAFPTLLRNPAAAELLRSLAEVENQRTELLNRFASVRCLCHEGHVQLHGEQRRNALAHDRVIVDEHHAQGGRTGNVSGVRLGDQACATSLRTGSISATSVGPLSTEGTAVTVWDVRSCAAIWLIVATGTAVQPSECPVASGGVKVTLTGALLPAGAWWI